MDLYANSMGRQITEDTLPPTEFFLSCIDPKHCRLFTCCNNNSCSHGKKVKD